VELVAGFPSSRIDQSIVLPLQYSTEAIRSLDLMD
jgi:hypothetical protein